MRLAYRCFRELTLPPQNLYVDYFTLNLSTTQINEAALQYLLRGRPVDSGNRAPVPLRDGCRAQLALFRGSILSLVASCARPALNLSSPASISVFSCSISSTADVSSF